MRWKMPIRYCKAFGKVEMYSASVHHVLVRANRETRGCLNGSPGDEENKATNGLGTRSRFMSQEQKVPKEKEGRGRQKSQDYM